MYRFECKYCNARFVSPPEGGVCPFCGGHDIREIKQPAITIPEPEEQVNPIQKAKSSLFRTLKYKGVDALSWMFLLVLCINLAIAIFIPDKRNALWDYNIFLAFGAIVLNLLLYRWGMIAACAVLLLIAFSLV